jgi:hypothetical protein
LRPVGLSRIIFLPLLRIRIMVRRRRWAGSRWWLAVRVVVI